MTSNTDRDCGRHRSQTAMALDADAGQAATDDVLVSTESQLSSHVNGGTPIPVIRVEFGTDGQPVGSLPAGVTWDPSLREITLDSDADGTIIMNYDDWQQAFSAALLEAKRGAGNCMFCGVRRSGPADWARSVSCPEREGDAMGCAPHITAADIDAAHNRSVDEVLAALR